MYNLIRNSLRSIFGKRLRSFLTIMGISIGVMSVVIISAIGEVGSKTVSAELDSIGISSMLVSTDKRITSKGLVPEDVSCVEGLDNIACVMPLLNEVTVVNAIGQDHDTMVWGVSEKASDIITMEVLYGRLMNRSDISSCANVCVIDESFARAAYKRANIVGKTIRVLLGGSYEEFTVVGVVKSGGNVFQSMLGDYIPSFIYAPYTTVQNLSGKAYYDQLAVRLTDASQSESTAGQIAKALSAQRKLDEGGIKVQNLVQQKEQLNNIMGIVTLILTVIAGISLVIAGLSIMTVMLVSVHERTREIGIKKSIGASRLAIMAEFLSESLLLSLIGSIIGSAIGIAACYVGCAVFGLDASVNPRLIGFSILFATAVGIVFGVYPAMKAANMKPVDALRYE